LIQFEPLSREEVDLVIHRLVDARIEALDAQERDVVDVPQVKSVLGRLAARSSNVRKLGKMADELISTILVRALLDPKVTEDSTNSDFGDDKDRPDTPAKTKS
jgi:hypothetical protein